MPEPNLRKCGICDREFTGPRIERHEELCKTFYDYMDLSDMSCRVCDKKYLNPPGLYRHISLCHQVEFPPTPKEQQPKKRGPKPAKIPMENVDDEIPDFDLGEKSDAEKTPLKQKNEKTPKRAKCGTCGNVLSRVRFEAHKEICEKYYEFTINNTQCRICDRSYQNIGDLYQHIKKVHQGLKRNISQKKSDEEKTPKEKPISTMDERSTQKEKPKPASKKKTPKEGRKPEKRKIQETTEECASPPKKAPKFNKISPQKRAAYEMSPQKGANEKEMSPPQILGTIEMTPMMTTSAKLQTEEEISDYEEETSPLPSPDKNIPSFGQNYGPKIPFYATPEEESLTQAPICSISNVEQVPEEIACLGIVAKRENHQNWMNQNVAFMDLNPRPYNGGMELMDPRQINKLFTCPLCQGKFGQKDIAEDHIFRFHRISIENQRRMNLEIEENFLY